MKILAVDLDSLIYKEFFDEITHLKKQKIVFTPNPEILLIANQDKHFAKLLKKADYLLPDGIWLYVAAQIIDSDNSKLLDSLLIPYYILNLFLKRQLLYSVYGERICGSDLTMDLVAWAEKSGTRITVIDLHSPGDERKQASQKTFKKKVKQKFPKLKLDYYIYDESKKEKIIEKIQASDSKILFSTLGMKKQEESVIEIMKEANNIKLWLGIGSSFDYMTGFQVRAPKVWRALWLEWLYRLVFGKGKIKRLKRLYHAIFVFLFQVIKSK